MRIHFLQTMWSDIILLQGEREAALIDTGTKEQFPMIMDYLENLGIRELSFILLTHFHRDHYGSISDLLDHVKVNAVYMKEYSGLDCMTSAGKPADDAYRAGEMEKYRELCEKITEKSRLLHCENTDQISFEGHPIRLFYTGNTMRTIYEDAAHPETYHRYALSENQNSLGALMEVNGVRVFFGGDLHDIPSTHPLADCVNTRIAHQVGGPVDIYKAPHHGTNGTGRLEALEIYRPKVVIITNGREYIPPESEIFQYLAQVSPDAKIFMTEKNHVVVTIADSGDIRTNREAESWISLSEPRCCWGQRE